MPSASPSRQLADYLGGWNENPDPAIASWGALFIYDAARQILTLPKPRRRAAIDSLPGYIQPLVEAEIMRVWKWERANS